MNEQIEVKEEGMTLLEVLRERGLTDPADGVAIEVNGVLRDVDDQVDRGDEVVIYDFASKEGKQVFWHTSAHVLAQAVLRLYPEAKPTIGPAIDNGFYYDFANLDISDEAFGDIEKEMKKICKENHAPKRSVFASKGEALERFSDNPYKQELIQELDEEGEISGYTQGEFFDLCRGPHLPSLGKIKALKLLKISGAYWRGDSSREMLTRIYAISFPQKELLKQYLEQLAEAKKRDHKVLGPQLGLFSIQEEAPGMPFIHPKGMVVWDKLLELLRSMLQDFGYEEIKTPSVMTRGLWETSGHWFHYKENMFAFTCEDRDFAIKPMNCPGCILYYQSKRHSYREFPLRIAEIGNVHRYEPSGALSGLFRVRSFHQDDAHIFLETDQIKAEILSILDMAQKLYGAFDLSFHLELSTRPESHTIGTDEEWEMTTQALQEALDQSQIPYRINPGDGAFYGPKIDAHIQDALGRTWQCGTIQLDMSLPQKFGLEYTSQEGTRKQPVMIHRALFGSVERFFGILIEHYAGKFPLWISPVQVVLMTVADRHLPYAQEVAQELRRHNYRVQIDASGESVGKKVRNAQLQKINYMVTLGDQELENHTLSVRTREGSVSQGVQLKDFCKQLKQEVETLGKQVWEK